jgi:hypothetical protein
LSASVTPLSTSAAASAREETSMLCGAVGRTDGRT